MRGNSLLQKRTRIRVFKNVQGNLPLKIPISTTRTTRSGRHNLRVSRANVPTLRESLLELATATQTQSRRQNGRRRCEYVDMEFILEMIGWIIYIQTKNQPQRTVKQLFDVTMMLVKERTEIQGDWQENSWKWTTLLTDRAVQLSTARAYVFTDSVLCIRRISENPVSAWKEKN